MHIRFDIARASDRTDAAFRYLRVSLFRLHFDRWAERHNISGYQFSSHEGNVRVVFRHRSEYTVFGLAWDNYNDYRYAIVVNEKIPGRP